VQWKFYHQIAGTENVYHQAGRMATVPGSDFLFKPKEPRQLLINGTKDLVVYNNPIGDCCHYPDRKK
jgi:hypothetical protein